MNIIDLFIKLRDDLKTWTTNLANTKVPLLRKVNGKTLENDINISSSDIEGVNEIENNITILENQLNGYSLLLTSTLSENPDVKTIYFSEE